MSAQQNNTQQSPDKTNSPQPQKLDHDVVSKENSSNQQLHKIDPLPQSTRKVSAARPQRIDPIAHNEVQPAQVKKIETIMPQSVNKNNSAGEKQRGERKSFSISQNNNDSISRDNLLTGRKVGTFPNLKMNEII
jgi:hypothetical protein